MAESPDGGTCETCGSPTRSEPIAITLWTSDGLIVIEDVPAETCDTCGEQYYDDRTQSALRRLSSGGFGKKHVVRTMTVPVYSLAGRTEAGKDMEEVA